MSFGLAGLKRIIAGMAVILLVSAQMTVLAVQYPTVRAEIPVSQTFTNNSGESVTGTFTYRITATGRSDLTHPMPEGVTDGTFSIEGNKKITLAVTFDRVGIYEYKINQESANKSTGYTYDSTVYTVTVYVRNDGEDGLMTDVFVQNPDGTKREADMEFSNSYQKQQATTGEPTDPPTSSEESTTETITTESVTTEEKTTEDNTTEEDKPKGNGTKTGDRVIWPYYLLLICGTTLFGACIRIKRLQK